MKSRQLLSIIFSLIMFTGVTAGSAAYAQSGFAAKMVTLNMVLFWASVFFMFWLSGRDQRVADDRISFHARSAPLVRTFSREESV